MKKIKLILICDTKNEIDDQLAIYYALKSPEIDLLGIVSTHNQEKHGINSVDIYHQETLKLIKLTKAKVPCFKGSRGPIESSEKPEKSKGVDFIINKIKKSKEKIIVACTGPCTDIANAILIDPKIKSKGLFIWHGGFKDLNEAELTRNQETNFLGDKLAAEIILESRANIILLPVFGVTENFIINSHLLARKLRQKNLPITKYLANLLEHNWERFGVIHWVIPKILKRFWLISDIGTIAVVKNFGIKSQKKILPYKIKNGKLVFFNKPQKGFRIINKINTYQILDQFEKYILS